MMADSGTAVAKTIADQTYQRIRRDIMTGELEPGTKLGMEMLTTRYEVGMSPLREALVRLRGDALVHAEGQRGFWVSKISIDELDDTMTTRKLVETEALSLSIEHGGPDWEERVKTAYAELSAAEERLNAGGEGTFAAWEAANRVFHDALISACGSPWLIRLRTMLHQHSERYRMISLASAPRERDVHDEHEAIVEAVLDRKALKACRLTEQHLDRTTEVVREALERRAEMMAVPPRSKSARKR